MHSELPKKQYEYTDHVVIDSTRWRVYNHRPGDIVISTSYKTGTTWMQTIVANLVFQDGAFPAPVSAMSPWLDMALRPLDQVAQALEAQTHRRFIKTHLPLDSLPYFERARYIVVGRDVRDVFMSIWNHHSGYSDQLKAITRERAAAFGRESHWTSRIFTNCGGCGSVKAGSIGRVRATHTGRIYGTHSHGGISATCPTSCWCTTRICWRIPRGKFAGSQSISTLQLTNSICRGSFSESRLRP